MRALFILCFAACASDATEIVAVIRTDLMLGHDLTSVSLEVEGPTEMFESEVDVVAQDAGSALPTFPVSMRLIRKGGPNEAIVVRASGIVESVTTIQQTRTLSFDEHRSRRLDLFLSCRCMQVGCADDETCSDGECVAESVDPLGLPIFHERDVKIEDDLTECACDTDLNQDGRHDVMDASIVTTCVRTQSTEELCERADVDCDGDIDDCDTERTVGAFRGDPSHCSAAFCGSCETPDGSCALSSAYSCGMLSGTFSACDECPEES